MSRPHPRPIKAELWGVGRGRGKGAGRVRGGGSWWTATNSTDRHTGKLPAFWRFRFFTFFWTKLWGEGSTVTYLHWQIYKNIYLWSRIRNTQLNIPKRRLLSMFHSPGWQQVCPPMKRKGREGKKPEKVREVLRRGWGRVGHKTGVLERLQVRAGWNLCCLHTFLHHGLTHDPTHILYSLWLRNLFPSIFSFDPTATLWARQNWH